MKIKLDFEVSLLHKVYRLYTFLIPFQHFPLVIWSGAAHGLERRSQKEFEGWRDLIAFGYHSGLKAPVFRPAHHAMFEKKESNNQVIQGS